MTSTDRRNAYQDRSRIFRICCLHEEKEKCRVAGVAKRNRAERVGNSVPFFEADHMPCGFTMLPHVFVNVEERFRIVKFCDSEGTLGMKSKELLYSHDAMCWGIRCLLQFMSPLLKSTRGTETTAGTKASRFDMHATSFLQPSPDAMIGSNLVHLHSNKLEHSRKIHQPSFGQLNLYSFPPVFAPPPLTF